MGFAWPHERMRLRPCLLPCLISLGFAMSSATAAPRSAKARAKVQPSIKLHKTKTAPPLQLKLRVGPTPQERKLMDALPSLVDGKMVYGLCGVHPCKGSSEAPKLEPSLPVKVKVESMGLGAGNGSRRGRDIAVRCRN